jgi:hypothetical protein
MRCLKILPLCFLIAPSSAPPQRPRDPWVFRSVLDSRARMVTIALSDEIWLAYDASGCGLYKAWKGGVHFDGAVYTTVHGPQPTSQGSVYLQESDQDAWSLTDPDGVRSPVHARWRGYILQRGQVNLQYDLELPNQVLVRIEETPEFVKPEKLFEDPSSQAPWLSNSLVGLRRTFTASGLPEGWSVSVAIQADCTGYLMERLTAVEEQEISLPDGSKGRRISGQVPLDAATPRNELMLFFPAFPEPKKK